MNATPNDLLTALKQAVMFSPQYVAPDSKQGKVWKCRQLQTWRFLAKDKGAELTSPNLGATICDKGKPYFWSRKWHESKYNPNNITFGYPALLLTELSGNAKNAFSKQSKRCYTYQLAVLDQQVADCKDCGCGGCEGRTINEINTDTESLLFAAMYYVSQVRYATLVPGGETGFLSIPYLAHLKECGMIAEYNPGADWGGLLNSQEVQTYRVAIEVPKIYGTAVNFTACFSNCEATEYNFNMPDFGILAAESGCKNCG